MFLLSYADILLSKSTTSILGQGLLKVCLVCSQTCPTPEGMRVCNKQNIYSFELWALFWVYDTVVENEQERGKEEVLKACHDRLCSGTAWCLDLMEQGQVKYGVHLCHMNQNGPELLP